MLKTNRISRPRAVTGSVAIAAMVAGGLALTASGTRAAAAVSERIGDAVGVELRAPAEPAPFTESAASAEPAAMPQAPAAPAAPRSKTVRRVTVVKDGKSQTYMGADADRFIAEHGLPVPPAPPAPPSDTLGVPPVPPAPLVGDAEVLRDRDGKSFRVFTRRMGDRTVMMTPPSVSERACRDGEGGGSRQVVLNGEKDGRRFVIVCRNRIAAMQAQGEQMAANSVEIERRAMRSAAAGLRAARARIEANTAMSAEARREALAGIDEGLAEVESERAGD